MDLTDEQWALIEPFIPKDPQGRVLAGLGALPGKCLTVSFGYFAQVLVERICQSGIHHTRPAIDAFRVGCEKE
jgi:hypothetical protein